MKPLALLLPTLALLAFAAWVAVAQTPWSP